MQTRDSLPAVIALRDYREQRARAEVTAEHAAVAHQERLRQDQAHAYQVCRDRIAAAEATVYGGDQNDTLSATQMRAQLDYLGRLDAEVNERQMELRNAEVALAEATARLDAAQQRRRRAAGKLAAAVELRRQLRRELALRALVREELRAEEAAELARPTHHECAAPTGEATC